MELAKVQSGALSKTRRDYGSPAYQAQLSALVSAMGEGRIFKNSPKNLDVVATVWYIALRKRVPIEWLKPTFEALIEQGGWFPDVSAFADKAEALMYQDAFSRSVEAIKASDSEEDAQAMNLVREIFEQAGIDRDGSDPLTAESKAIIDRTLTEGGNALLRDIYG